METMVISHCADMDGIGCAALLKMKYDIPSGSVFLIDYSSAALEAVERAIKKARPKETNLFITDLNASDQTADTFLSIISTIRKGGGSVFWFDHHPWTKNTVKKISKGCDTLVCGEKRVCASEITARKLKLGGKFVDRFLDLCHHSDFNLKPKDRQASTIIKTYALGIASYNTKPEAVSRKKLFALAETLADGRFTNKDIVAEARTFEEISNRRIKIMVKDLSLVGGKIAVGFARSLQSTNACYHITEASGRDIGIFINLDAKKGNIRSKQTNITPLARAFEGGGHPHASGFSFDMKKYDVTTRRGRLLLLDRIDKEAEKLEL